MRIAAGHTDTYELSIRFRRRLRQSSSPRKVRISTRPFLPLLWLFNSLAFVPMQNHSKPGDLPKRASWPADSWLPGTGLTTSDYRRLDHP